MHSAPPLRADKKGRIRQPEAAGARSTESLEGDEEQLLLTRFRRIVAARNARHFLFLSARKNTSRKTSLGYSEHH